MPPALASAASPAHNLGLTTVTTAPATSSPCTLRSATPPPPTTTHPRPASSKTTGYAPINQTTPCRSTLSRELTHRKANTGGKKTLGSDLQLSTGRQTIGVRPRVVPRVDRGGGFRHIRRQCGRRAH